MHPQVVRQQQALWKEKERELSGLLSMLGVPDCLYPGPLKTDGSGVVRSVCHDFFCG